MNVNNFKNKIYRIVSLLLAVSITLSCALFDQVITPVGDQHALTETPNEFPDVIIEKYVSDEDGSVTITKGADSVIFSIFDIFDPVKKLSGINLSILYDDYHTLVHFEDPTEKYLPKFISPPTIFGVEQRDISLVPANDEGYIFSKPVEVEIELEETDFIKQLPLNELMIFIQENYNDENVIMFLIDDPESLNEDVIVNLYSSPIDKVLYAHILPEQRSSIMDWTATPAYAEPITIGVVLTFLGKAILHLIHVALIIDHMTVPVGGPEDSYFENEIVTYPEGEEPIKVITVNFSGNPNVCPAVEIPPAIDVVLVIDVSGSMSGARLAAAKSSAIKFINKLNPETDRVGLVSFTDEATILSNLSENLDSLANMVGGLEANGGTAIDEGLSSGHSIMQNGSRPEAQQVVVLLSDGQSDPEEAREAANQIKSDNITLLTVGVGEGTDQALLSNLASTSIDYLFSSTNQGLRELFDETAQRLITGRIVARDVSIQLQIDTENYAFVNSMLPEDTLINSPANVEWHIPVLYEGYEISRPVVVRQLSVGNTPIGTVQINYAECQEGPQVILDPEIIQEGVSKSDILSDEVLQKGSTSSGTLDAYDAKGFALDIQEPGLYSVVVEGAGSEIPPEIFTGNGEEYLYPLYTLTNENNSTSFLPTNNGKLLKPSLLTEGRTSVFYVENPMMYWFYLQSNSADDSGDYSVSIVEGAIDNPPDYQVGVDEISVPLNVSETKVYDLLGAGEGDTITFFSDHSNEDGWTTVSVVSLDGEYSRMKYYIYEREGPARTYVVEIMGEGPYKLLFRGDEGQAELRSEVADVLLMNSGNLQLGDSIDSTLESGHVDAWSFEGYVGDGVIITMNREEGGRLTLLGPEVDDRYIDVTTSAYQDTVTIGPMELPVQGEYMIVVRSDFYAENGGVYSLSLEAVNLPDVVNETITPDENKIRTLIGGREDKYTFEGLQGQIVTIDLSTENWNMNPILKLIGPNDVSVMETETYYEQIIFGPLELPENGVYTIIVGGSLLGGEYELNLVLE